LVHDDDPDDDYDDDYDNELDDDSTDDLTLDMIECPKCGLEIHDDTPQCPLCGEWISPSTSPWQGRSWWWVVLGILGCGAVIFALTMG
jgi:hypothetical protein